MHPDDPLAQRARLDLQRIHRAMRTVTILKSAIALLRLQSQPRQILELGAGDGTVLLRLARTMRPRWTCVELTLLDRQSVISDLVRSEFEQLDWHVNVLCIDSLRWAQPEYMANHYDLCLTTLFLHHFEHSEITAILKAVASSTNAFIACEPRRNSMGHLGSRLVGLLGSNEVTREDAVKSVAAGFTGLEISALWPHTDREWIIREYSAWPFSHCCAAVARTAPSRE